jgi:hypothetical protein
MATCFDFIKAIGHTLLVHIVCVMNWPDDGFNKAETCCHVTN